MMRRCSWLLISFALLAGCATAPKPEVPRTPSYAFAAPSSTPLGREIAGKRQAAGGQSGLFLLGQGVEAFSARAGLARRATRTLDVQYYAIFVDDAGSLLLQELVDAARRGVRVRLLLDDLHTAGQQLDLALLASVPGIEVRVFNPFAGRSFAPARLLEFIADGERLNRRMHNKAWIADNVGAIIGGRNLGNKTEVLAGIGKDALLVNNPNALLRDGDSVRAEAMPEPASKSAAKP